MPRPRKPPDPPPRRTWGGGSISFDARRQMYLARLPRDARGKREASYCETRAEAEAWITRMLARGTDSFDARRPLGEYLRYWYRLQVPRWKPNQQAKVRSQVETCRPIAHHRLDRLRADHILELLAELDGRKVTRRYAHAIGRLLYRALAFAVKVKILGENVADSVELPEPERLAAKAWDTQEVQRVDAAIIGHRFEAAYLTMLYAGLRIGEVLPLLWTDFDFAADTLTVDRAEYTAAGREIGSPKYDSGGTIPVPRRITVRIKAIRDRQVVLSPYVLGKPDGTRWNPTTITRDWYAMIAEAKVRRLTPHAGRHSFAVGHMVAGTDLADIAALMRHASPAVTAQAYLSGSKQRQREAAERLDELFSGTSGTDGQQIGKHETS